MGLNQIFEEQQNATKLKMVIYFARKDWLSKTRKVKWKLSETGTEVLGDSEHSMVSHRGKNTTYDNIAQRFFWHNIAADINKYVKLRVSNSAKNKVT